LVRRGHSLQALLHDYPMDLVLNLLRAAEQNIRKEVLDQVEAVSLGIRDAIDPKAGLLGKLRQVLLNPGAVPQPEAPAKISPRAMAWMQGLPVKRGN